MVRAQIRIARGWALEADAAVTLLDDRGVCSLR